MPVRSLNSPLLKWPDRQVVDAALRAWAADAARLHPETSRIGVFGSFARGDWSFGSDLDLIVLVRSTDRPVHERTMTWDTFMLPVPADLLIYTEAEWTALMGGQTRFRDTLQRELRWVWPAPDND